MRWGCRDGCAEWQGGIISEINTLEGRTTRVVQACKKMTEKRLKWYGHVRRMKEEHIVRRMLDVDIPGKRRRRRPNIRWKDTCKRDMTEVGLKRTTRQTGQHWGIRSSAIPATPDDGTSQGRRRRRRRRRINYNDGAVYFALRSWWVKHTLTKGLNRRILRQSNHVWWKCGWAFHMLQYPKRNHRNQTRRKTH